jgi:hypothetical protein
MDLKPTRANRSFTAETSPALTASLKPCKLRSTAISEYHLPNFWSPHQLFSLSALIDIPEINKIKIDLQLTFKTAIMNFGEKI